MSAHTPGPWDVLAGRPTGGLKIVAGSMMVATVARANLDFAFNARLIAAAPELLEALEECETWIQRSAPRWVKDGVRAVIDKATGSAA